VKANDTFCLKTFEKPLASHVGGFTGTEKPTGVLEVDNVELCGSSFTTGSDDVTLGTADADVPLQMVSRLLLVFFI
jgi:hypothetical protein